MRGTCLAIMSRGGIKSFFFVSGLLLLGACEPAVMPSDPALETEEQALALDRFNYVIGTQAFQGRYQFTGEPWLIENANIIKDMGSNTIKTTAGYDQRDELDRVLKMPFSHYFLWFHQYLRWEDGLSDQEKKELHREMYLFVRELLIDHNKSGKTVFIGHWEGDWMLIPDYDGNKNPEPKRMQGFIDWLNVRQKAVDEAKRDTPHEGIEVFHFTEVNRVRDAMDKGKTRVVNAVLPKVSVDYVSYSCYDVQRFDKATVHATLDYIEDHLPRKSGLSGRRVFIGEFGFPAYEVGYNGAEHDRKNRELLLKFLGWNPPYVLYWQVYDNRLKNGKAMGYWLIDEKNQRQPLFHTLKELLGKGKGYVADFQKKHGKPPTTAEYLDWAGSWLGGQKPCTDIPPDKQFTCQQQAGWKKCNESFMKGFCDRSCGRC